METNKPQNYLATNNITTEEYIYCYLDTYWKDKSLKQNFFTIILQFRLIKEVMVKWQD